MKRKQWLTFVLCILLILPLFTVSVQAEPADTESAITEPNIVSEAAILMDARTKTVLYEKNASEKHYPASITKLMTALIAIENLSPDQHITFSKEAIFGIEPGSSHISIQVDEILTVDQALHGLLLMSANEVANGLAEAVSGSIDAFANLMTDRAKALGAQNTHFVNPHGLHDENHYTTAYDMALIGSALADNKYFLEIMKDMTFNIPPTNKTDEARGLYQQHPMLNPMRNPKLYREDVIGGKTGYTDQARQTLVTIAKQGNTTLVAVVLQAEKPTVYSDTASLLDYGFSSYQTLTLHRKGELIKTLPSFDVISGQAYQSRNYGLALSEDAQTIALKSISNDDIMPSYDLPEALDVSCQIGDTVGTVAFTLKGQTLWKGDLVVASIEELPGPVFEIHETSFWSLSRLCMLAACIFITLVALLLIILLARKKMIQRKYSKINRYFK